MWSDEWVREWSEGGSDRSGVDELSLSVSLSPSVVGVKASFYGVMVLVRPR